VSAKAKALAGQYQVILSHEDGWWYGRAAAHNCEGDDKKD